MEIRRLLDPAPAAPLFAEWPETMIWSCLHGCMGQAYSNGSDLPQSARIDVGDFSFFAGAPDAGLVLDLLPPGFRILVPRDGAWAACIEAARPDARTWTRYATKKDPSLFDRARLSRLTSAPPYRLCPIDEALYGQIQELSWAKDLTGQFSSWQDYKRRGLGTVALHGGKIVSGASSYTVYPGGIEIEVDTRPDYRRRGLARACAARLILDCLDSSLYPSWDAHSQASLALAQQLGYLLDRPYPVYEIDG